MKGIKFSKWAVFGFILVTALVAFEMFNFDTTRYAISTIVDEPFLGWSWAGILALAFSGIDFAGIARIFTPETDMRSEPAEVWFLTGAWVVAACFNALLTWWAVATHMFAADVQGNALVTTDQLFQYAPVLLATIVFLTRLLIIGTIASAGDHLFNTKTVRSSKPVRKAPAARKAPASLFRPTSATSPKSSNSPNIDVGRFLK